MVRSPSCGLPCAGRWPSKPGIDAGLLEEIVHRYLVLARRRSKGLAGFSRTSRVVSKRASSRSPRMKR